MSCHKATETSTRSLSFDSLETEVVRDFATCLVFTRYGSLLNATVLLQDKITRLNNETNESNLYAARTEWKNMRADWELSEGFLLGPVESNDYDPNTDTWPTDYVQMDSLLTSTNPLREEDIKNLPQSLRGYHPLEYMLWGKGGTRTPAQLTVRQKLYMVSLIADLLNNNVQALYNDWFLGSDNFQNQVLTAGKGSNTFSSRQALFLNIVSAMSDICDEVGSSKMFEPFIALDSAISESPYSSNTLTDFRNNILGLQQVYMGLDGNKGIRNLVAAKNLQLDQNIQIRLNAAVSSFNLITARYEEAIFTQRPQIMQTMDQLAALNELLETDLKNFIIRYIKD
jgi:putative iron-regulated protein